MEKTYRIECMRHKLRGESVIPSLMPREQVPNLVNAHS